MGILKIDRRTLLAAGFTAAGVGATGLYLGFWYGKRKERYRKRLPDAPGVFRPNVYLSVDSEGVATIWLTKAELGQGVKTALPMIVAEELEVPWRQVKVVQALANGNYGDMMTAVSTSIRSNIEDLRKAGAAAREMLLKAGSDALGVPTRYCRAQQGHVIDERTGRRVGYGAIALAASNLPVPENPTLKSPDDFTLIGTPVTRIDLPEKVDGSAQFGADVRVAEMRFAAMARPPVFGGTVASYDESATRQVPGVETVLPLSNRLAVVATNTWAAFAGRKALKIEWNEGPHASLNDAEIDRRLTATAEGAADVARSEGTALAAIGQSSRVFRAEYRLPYLAHTAMEPPTATVKIDKDRCEIWAPTQNPQKLQTMAMERLGLPAVQVVVHTTYLGAAFGRRVESDEFEDALEIAKQTGRPIQVVWPREEDVQHDYYRPCTVHRMAAALDEAGRPMAWHHRIVGPSILKSRAGFQEPIDPTAVEGAVELPYGIEHVHIEHAHVDLPIPVGFWRSVGHSYNAFAVESFLNELTHEGGQDPVALRRDLLKDQPRHLGVMNAVLERSKWYSPLPEGRARGLAVHASFGSYAAQVAEVSLTEDGRPRVHRVTVAVDAGRVVNPDTVRAQMEGGVIFGLGAALSQAVHIEEGRVRQSNFHDYPTLRMPEAPEIDVHIVPSEAPSGGIGEVGVPPIAPALTHGILQLTGKTVRKLPVGLKNSSGKTPALPD